MALDVAKLARGRLGWWRPASCCCRPPACWWWDCSTLGLARRGL